jgi:hypothetical protein
MLWQDENHSLMIHMSMSAQGGTVKAIKMDRAEMKDKC